MTKPRVHTRGTSGKDKLKGKRGLLLSFPARAREFASSDPTTGKGTGRKTGFACPSCLWYGKNEAQFKKHWRDTHAGKADHMKIARITSSDIFKAIEKEWDE
jgi:hypothetical protein